MEKKSKSNSQYSGPSPFGYAQGQDDEIFGDASKEQEQQQIPAERKTKKWKTKKRGGALLDGDAAVGGGEADGGAAGAEVGVDFVAVDSGLIGGWVVEGDAAVGGFGLEMRGVVCGDGDGDCAVGGAEVETRALPGGAVEGGVDAAVGGADLDVAG